MKRTHCGICGKMYDITPDTWEKVKQLKGAYICYDCLNYLEKRGMA